MLKQSLIPFPPHLQDFKISGTSVKKCNSQGISHKKAELMDLKTREKSDDLYIQENMLQNQTIFNLINYNELFKEGHTNYRAHGGVAVII